jgi:hypothetical protein
MAIVVEDGTIVAGANSYTDAAALNAYLDVRGLQLSFQNGDEEALLHQAMDYIETRDFIGNKLTKAQSTQWPRSGVSVDGFPVEEDEIPSDLSLAQIETAIAIDNGTDPLANIERETKREKVGDVEVEYMDKAKDSVELTAIDARLDKLLVRGGSAGTVDLMRA